MKVTKYCKNCLRRLAENTCFLSHAEREVLWDCFRLIEETFDENVTPPYIANKIFGLIKEKTHVLDPYREKKDKELTIAKKVTEKYYNLFSKDLEGALKFSALGNSTDTFLDTTNGDFLKLQQIEFYTELDKIEEEIHKHDKDVLFLGDNVFDFLFDMKLIRFLEDKGKKVYYAVKESPIQNDLSIIDVFKYQFHRIFSNIISTGNDRVGLEKKDIKGRIKEFWDGDAVVIAKGMGNYETISEFKDGRKVIHIMKVKCPAVSEAISHPEGTYVAIVR
ncbi:MAG: ARMT1-like domain-containing protein [Syntrophorhabdaceae bacterium]|nr:ARMT1-like domain-containing protein [Syntrophorhabdaceae bacterium]